MDNKKEIEKLRKAMKKMGKKKYDTLLKEIDELDKRPHKILAIKHLNSYGR